MITKKTWYQRTNGGLIVYFWTGWYLLGIFPLYKTRTLAN